MTLKEIIKEYSSIIFIASTILVMFLLASWLSPTPREQLSYLQYFFMTLAIFYVLVTVIVLVVLGFKKLGYYMAIFLAITIYMGGLYAAAITILLTYLSWGFVFALETLLAYHGVKSAKEWFVKRYDYKSFESEYRIFYPLVMFLYFLLEWAPNKFHGESIASFNPNKVLEEMKEILR
ncbi:MAG: hypothetical protein HF962_05495 [Sulfurovum sp.]|nr:hypothetical protein [Sulfurovum sp.]